MVGAGAVGDEEGPAFALTLTRHQAMQEKQHLWTSHLPEGYCHSSSPQEGGAALHGRLHLFSRHIVLDVLIEWMLSWIVLCSVRLMSEINENIHWA